MANDTAYDVTRQLDYYANNNVTTSSNESYTAKQFNGTITHWWLRTANASYTYGLAPTFRIG